MIQRRAPQTRSRVSGGNPNGPTANETRVTAVAAKKKIEAAATRRRSSCAASLAAIAQTRSRDFIEKSPSPPVPQSPSPLPTGGAWDWGTERDSRPSLSQLDDLVGRGEISRLVGGDEDDSSAPPFLDDVFNDRPA